MKKLLFAITFGLFVAGVATASLGEYWSTVSHLIPRTNDAVDIGSTSKRVRTLFVNNLTCTDCVDDTNVDWGTGTNQVSSCDVPDHNGHSVRDTFVHIVNRGVAEAITVTLTGGLGVSWTTGEIYDRANHTFVATDAGSGNVTNNVVNYLKWVSGTTLTLSTSDATGNEVLIAIGTIYDGNIDGYREMSLLDESLANIRRCARAVFPTRVTSGMSVHEDTDATNPLDVTMDAGVYCKEIQERITPAEIKSRNTAMVRHFHTGGAWDSDTNAQIETTNYDNGTGKTAIPANKYVKGLFIYMNGKIGFVYPRAYFNTIAQAQAAALPSMPTGLEPIPKLTAVVYQQGAANFTGAVWQDVRAGISEESFSGVTDHGALAGLSDDDHTIYTLADGTRAFTGTQTFNENLEMKDDKILYLSTAKDYGMKYSSAHSGIVWEGGTWAAETGWAIYANTSADASGNWEPYIDIAGGGGIVKIVNTTNGSAGNKYFLVDMTDGIRLDTGGNRAIILADNIATADKTFQFPNFSGTFITSGNLTDITTVGTIAAGTWNGTSIADANVDNNITVTGYMQDTDIDTFTELQSWVSDETLLKAGTLTDAKYCIYDSASTDIICNSTPAGTGDLLADGSIPMTADFNLDGNNLDNGGVIFLKEQADADADIAGQGQIWVNTATPNELWFTDDAGTDVQLGAAGSTPTVITVADESADTSCYVGYFTAATGDLGPKTGTNLTFNSSTGILTATGFAGDITGALTGNASTATALAANGGNCAAGSAALGVDASGAVESCFDVWTEAENTAAGYTSNTGDVTQVFDCASGDCNTMTVGTSEYLTYGTGYIDANRFAGVTTVDSTEFGYLNGLTAAIVQTGSASHDGFSDFVANEHLDWTADLGATNIHAGNYTSLTDLTDFDQTAWRLFYSNNLGDVIELSLGTDGQYLKSQGGTSSLTWGTPTNTTYTGGTGITLTGTVFSTTDSEIVHDNLSGFVANEHLDWTSDLGATNIHAANYTDTNTTYTAGRSLTLDGTTINADAETYTGKHKVAFETPTATDDFFFGEVATAQTFTSIYCKTLVGTVNLDISIAGTDINGTDITCTTAGVLDSSLGGDTAGAVGEEVKLLITSVASDPTYLMVQLNYTYND